MAEFIFLFLFTLIDKIVCILTQRLNHRKLLVIQTQAKNTTFPQNKHKLFHKHCYFLLSLFMGLVLCDFSFCLRKYYHFKGLVQVNHKNVFLHIKNPGTPSKMFWFPPNKNQNCDKDIYLSGFIS